MADMSFEEYRKFLQSINPDANCPVKILMEILSKKWNLRVVFELTRKDSLRFGELKSQISSITNSSLSSTLKELEENGLINRIQYNEIPPHVEYSLTEKGKMLYPIFAEMGKWVQTYGI